MKNYQNNDKNFEKSSKSTILHAINQKKKLKSTFAKKKKGTVKFKDSHV